MKSGFRTNDCPRGAIGNHQVGKSGCQVQARTYASRI